MIRLKSKSSSKIRAKAKQKKISTGLKSRFKLRKIPIILILLLVAAAGAFFIFRSRAAAVDINTGYFYPAESYFTVANNTSSYAQNGKLGYQFKDATSTNGVELKPKSTRHERLTVWPAFQSPQVSFCATIEGLSTDPAIVYLRITLSDGKGKQNTKFTVNKSTATKTGTSAKEYCAVKAVSTPEYMSEGFNANYNVDVAAGSVNVTKLKRTLVGALTSNTNLPVELVNSPTAGEPVRPQFAAFPVAGDRDKILNDPRAEGEQYKPGSTKSCADLHNGYCAADIYAETGTPILSMTNGTVSSVKNNEDGSSSTGARIQIQDEASNNTYYYAHLKSGSIGLNVGDKVKAGDQLGVLGDDTEAQSTVRHLHIDITPGTGSQYNERPNCDGPTCSSIAFVDVKRQLDMAWANVPHHSANYVAGLCEPPVKGLQARQKMIEIYGADKYAEIRSKIEQNKAVYKQAATETGVPWQALAALHIHENNQSRDNPENGQGIYGFYSLTKNTGATFPTGPVDDAEFQRQTTLAAQILVEKSREAGPNKGTLTYQMPLNVLYEAMFGYNGRSAKYRDQAEDRGFNPETEGFQGSPYVMNFVDDSRNPRTNTTSWGQITSDGGSLSFPVNIFAGAALIYEDLAGPYCSRTEEMPAANYSTDIYFLTDSIVKATQSEIATGMGLGEGSFDFGDIWAQEPRGAFTTYFNSVEGRSIESGSVQTGLAAVQQDAEVISSAKLVFISLGSNVNEANFEQSAISLIDQVKAINPNAKIAWMNLASAGSTYPYSPVYLERNRTLQNLYDTGKVDGVYNWHETVFGYELNILDPSNSLRTLENARYLAPDGLHIQDSLDAAQVISSWIYWNFFDIPDDLPTQV